MRKEDNLGFSRREFLQATLVTASGLLTGAAALNSFARDPKDVQLRFVMISDTHVGSPGDAERLEKAIPWIRREDPAFVLHGGDVVENLMTNPKEVARARSGLDSLGVPVHLAPGNHDVGLRDTPRLREQWSFAFGPTEQIIHHGEWTFVGLDSMAFAERTKDRTLEDEVFAFLEGPVAKLDGRRTILFYHVPEIPLPLPGAIAWSATAQERWFAFVGRLRPAAVLTGHWHMGVKLPTTAHPLFVAPPISGRRNFATGYLRCSLKGDLLLCERVMIEKENKRELPGLVNWILLPEGAAPG